MSKLHRVLPGKYLHYPQEIGGRDRVWLNPGGVVDLDDPFVAHSIVGQEYKLSAEPDPDAKQADPFPHPKLVRLREEFQIKGGVKPAPPTKAEKLVAVGASEAGEVQVPDARPQRSTAKAS